MNGLESVASWAACMIVGFGMGREWQRVMGKPKDDCPFGDECQACHPISGTVGARAHYIVRMS